MGGAVGLKGTDGKDTLKEAMRRGARPVSPERAKQFLRQLKTGKGNLKLVTAPGTMGTDTAKSAGVKAQVLGRIGARTTARDTVRIAKLMMKEEVGLLAFCGGDGTARDIMEAVDEKLPVMGVPAGVKVYSSVFATSPAAAAESVLRFLEGDVQTREGEVLDIDEVLYRKNELSVKLLGRLITPDTEVVVDPKSPSPLSEAEAQESIAEYVLEEFVKPDAVYVLGPGSTVEKVGQKLGVKKTLLGVDVVKGDGTVLGSDVDENMLLQLVRTSPVKVIVSPIGGQGFLFGRGNQQISPRVLKQIGVDNVIIVGSRGKLDALFPRRLLVDTGDAAVDEALKGYKRVITGYREEMVVKVE